jgi:hypothetical protein
MGIATPSVTPAAAANQKVAARRGSNAGLFRQLASAQSASYAEFWSDPVNMAAAWGTDLEGTLAAFAQGNQMLLGVALHDRLVEGIDGAPNTLSKPVSLPGFALNSGADPTLAASYTAVYPAGWSIAFNADGSGTPVKAA